jgi:pseudaminic acid biosynthesis-associated methylase
MKDFKTDQEQFWAEEFGDAYIDRNQKQRTIAANTNLFSKVFSRTRGIESIIEFGANIGLNQKAIKILKPEAKRVAVEINERAAKILGEEIGAENVINESILELDLKEQFDMSFIKGVLIHINPDDLQTVYEKLYSVSKRYILVTEYYNPSPVKIPYRGYSDRLFKRDFAGEIMNKYPDLELIDYGFTYRRDPNFKLDDSTWFLMERR